jgi:hypothetical protein
LKRSYDSKFYEQEVLGKYLNVHEGLVYYAFDRERNLADIEVDPNLPLLWALDFNVNPMCSVIAQIREEEVLVIDEIVMSHASTPEVCEEFQERYPRHTAGIVVYGDASGTKMQTSGTTDYQMIRKSLSGYASICYRVPRANPQVRERTNLVNAMLRSAGGETQLLVDRKCKELVLDLQEVSYKPGSSVVDKDSDPRRTHLSDALGYLIWQECRPRGPIGEQKWKLL